MSKFFITNKSELFGKVKDIVKESDYKESFTTSCHDCIFALSTSKLTINNQNGIQINDGFSIVTGTMAWASGEAVSGSILPEIYNLFDGDINKIRKKSLGNFACSIYKDNILYVFGEIAGFYNIYFYHIGKEWLISNSLYDLQLILREKLTIDKLCLEEATIQDGIMLDGTYFNEIKRLSGFNYLRITADRFDVIEETQSYPLAQGSLRDKVERYKELSLSYGKIMSSAYGNPVVSMTGGLDARMVMSSYLAAGAKPHLYYGTGNSFITNTYHQDRDIDLQFAEKFGLTFHDESWNTPDPIDKYWGEHLPLYGFCYDTYSGSNDFVDSIKKNPCQLMTFGYCGELLRNLPWIESRKSNYFTLKEYLNEFYLPEKIKMQVANVEEYEQHIWSKLLKICSHYNLDINNIANEDIFYLSLERRKSADAQLVNFTNLIKYCSYSLGQYENLCAGRVTCAEAANSSFMLHCLNALYPSVLDVSVFSHCSMRIFDRNTMRLKPGGTAKSFVIKYFPGAKIVANQILGRKKNWRFSNDKAIYEYVLSLYDKYEIYGFVNRNQFVDKRRLINYVMKLFALKSLAAQKE